MTVVPKERPVVSVIMPCLNAERYVGEAIACVLTQTLADLELIVIDNGSVDRTLEIVRAVDDPRLRVVEERERGVSRARNMGLRYARGELVAFLDADDMWAPMFLEKMHAALAQTPHAVVAYCGWQNVGLQGPRGEPFVPPEYEGTDDKVAALLINCRWPIHAALTRSAAITAAGGFDTGLVIAEDYLLWLELASQGQLVRVPETLAYYRHHGAEQATGNRALAALHSLQAKQTFLQRHPNIARHLGAERIEQLTWGELIREGNALYWGGELEHARPVLRTALLAGRGTLGDKLRMLPCLLPIWMHRTIVAMKQRMGSRKG